MRSKNTKMSKFTAQSRIQSLHQQKFKSEILKWLMGEPMCNQSEEIKIVDKS